MANMDRPLRTADLPAIRDFKETRKGWFDLMMAALRRGQAGDDLAKAYTGYWDEYLITSFEQSLETWAEKCSLYALGGYGREEMCPFSDIDLMVLVPEEAEPELMTAVEGFIRTLWAVGVRLGHSVRTSQQCLDYSADNTQIASSILDARYIGGAKDIFPDPMESVRTLIRETQLDEFVSIIHKGLKHRRRQFGDADWLLEPQVKLGRGGLRDIHAIGWASELLFGSRNLPDLVDSGVVWRGEATRVMEARSYLLRTRFALHLHHHWKQDQLTYAAQPHVAAMMGHGEPHVRASLNRFMQAYYVHVREIATVADLWFESWNAPSSGEQSGAHLAVGQVSDLSKNPTRLFELLEHAQDHGKKLPSDARRALTTAAPALPPSVAVDKFANSVVRRIICDINDTGDLLKTIAEAGVLARVVPEWAHLVGYAQHDTYHVLTADVHLLTTCRRLKALLRGDLEASSPYLTKVAARYKREASPDALILTALLHDIGKGLQGDHSIIGSGLGAEVAHRMGFSSVEMQTIRRLIGEHLTMPKISQRRDIQNRTTVQSFCKIVRGRRLLDGLALLSFVDMDSVAPGNLNRWKQGLLETLHKQATDLIERGDLRPEESQTREVLRAVLEQDMPPATVERIVDELPSRFLEACPLPQLVRVVTLLDTVGDVPEVAFHDAPEQIFTEVLVFEPTYPPRLADVAAVLSLAGLDIRAARSCAVGQRASLDVFQVRTVDKQNRAIPQHRRQRIADNLRDVLSGQGSLAEVLAKKLSESRLPPRARPDVEVKVDVDNAFDPDFTLLEVKSADRAGLLAAIAQTLGELDLFADRSIITTEGDRAIDTFYLTDRNGKKLTGSEALKVQRKLRRGLRQAS